MIKKERKILAIMKINLYFQNGVRAKTTVSAVKILSARKNTGDVKNVANLLTENLTKSGCVAEK